MVASILRAHAGEAALATQGNFNNDIGVPLTLLRLREHHRLAVVELGMNHPGEIAGLAHMAQPTVALVNNAQREHLEFMATVQAVARENGSVISVLPDHGVAVFPADDEHTPLWRELAGARRVLTFALDTEADLTAQATLLLEPWSGKEAPALPALGIEEREGGWTLWVHTPAIAERFSAGSSLDTWLRNQADAYCTGNQWLPLLSPALAKASAFKVGEVQAALSVALELGAALTVGTHLEDGAICRRRAGESGGGRGGNRRRQRESRQRVTAGRVVGV
jgi:hypothetical protein